MTISGGSRNQEWLLSAWAARSLRFRNASSHAQCYAFFRGKTSAPLTLKFKFLPRVKGITDRSGLAGKYNAMLGQAGKLTPVPDEQKTVEGYVTQRVLDGLFYRIGEEERAIRQDPVGTGSKILGKVFGGLK